MATTTLIDIQIPKQSIDAAKSSIAAYRSEIAQLKEDQKNLKKQNKEGTDGYTENALALKKLTSQLKENERVLVANQKVIESENGSLDQMRSSLSLVTTQWNKLSKEERENTEAGKKLTKQKTELTAELKKVEGATGDTRRNVGNYSEGMKEALTTSGLFSREQAVLAKGQKLYAVATKAATNSTKLFRVALISTGIGAIAVALGTLIGYLTSTQEGMDKITAVTRPLAAIFEKLKGVGQELGKVMFEAFANPQESVKKLWEAIKTNIVNRVAGVGEVFKTLAKIISSGFTDGYEELGNATLKVTTGVDDLIGKTKNAATATGEFFKEAAKSGAELDRLQKQIEKTEVNLTRKRAELNAEYERSKEIAQDQSKSEEERRRASEQAISAQNELLKQQQDYLDLKIQKQELENSLNDTSREDEKALQDLLAERTQLEAEASRKRASANNLLNTINKQAAAEAKRLQKERTEFEAQQAEERKAIAEAEAQAKIEAAQLEFENKMEALKTQSAEEVNILKEKLLEDLITREEYEQELLDLDIASLEMKKAALESHGESVIGIEQNILDKKLSQKEKEKDADDKVTELKKANQQAQLDSVQSTLGTTASLFNKNTAAYKVLASAEAAINTYKSATAAYAAVVGLVPAGPVLAPLAAAAAVASGVAQIAKINNTQMPKFKDGVIGVEGAGTGTSDSITAKISRGESVMTAKATSVYAPQLAAMEKSVGNTPNYQLGNRHYASGIINAGATAATTSARADIAAQETITKDLSSVQIVTKISDIERVQSQNAAANDIAEVA